VLTAPKEVSKHESEEEMISLPTQQIALCVGLVKPPAQLSWLLIRLRSILTRT